MGRSQLHFFEKVKPIASIVVFISPWFIAVLILISCVSCGIVVLFNHIGKDDKKRDILNIVVFDFLAIELFDVSFFGKRIPTYLCVYLIGYYLVTADRIIKRIIKLKWFLVAGWIIASVVNILLFVSGVFVWNTSIILFGA